MQDQYAGDVGDFGKFGLLRHLLDGGDLATRLGVVWYHYTPTETSNDGRHTAYHELNPRLCSCDAELAGLLKPLLVDRRLAALETAGILPKSTVYFARDLNFATQHPRQTNRDKAARLRLREQWLHDARREVRDCDLVFLDPDNGLEIRTCSKKSQLEAGKYVYLDEIQAFKETAPLVIIYHHLGRTGGDHPEQITAGLQRLLVVFGAKAKLFALRFRPYSPRAFFLACSPELAPRVRRKLDAFMAGRWRDPWDNYITPD